MDALEPGTVASYALDINGTRVWPDPSSGFPPSRIATRCRSSSAADATSRHPGRGDHGLRGIRSPVLSGLVGPRDSVALVHPFPAP
ncbi:hypothetical protein [Arthrobacter sp. TE12232]